MPCRGSRAWATLPRISWQRSLASSGVRTPTLAKVILLPRPICATYDRVPVGWTRKTNPGNLVSLMSNGLLAACAAGLPRSLAPIMARIFNPQGRHVAECEDLIIALISANAMKRQRIWSHRSVVRGKFKKPIKPGKDDLFRCKSLLRREPQKTCEIPFVMRGSGVRILFAAPISFALWR